MLQVCGRQSGKPGRIGRHVADVDRTLIAELPFDTHRLAELLVKDRADNPSNYAMVVISEGAKMLGGEVVQHGPIDAYGNRRLGGIGQILGDELSRITGIGTITQNLGYMMRSGVPDALDQMVAKSYGIMAVQLLSGDQHGLMMALRDGKYTTVPADTCLQGRKRVDIDELYDVEAYRPRITRVFVKPMFLY